MCYHIENDFCKSFDQDHMNNNLCGEVIGGKYDLTVLLGEGGSGVVYLAKKIGTSERYAIKTLSSPGKKKQVILQYVNRLKRSINTYGSTGKSISK